MQMADRAPNKQFPSGLTFGEVRTQDRIAARFRSIAVNAEYQDSRVWALNPFGIELIAPTCYEDLASGQRVQVDLIHFGQRTKFDGMITSKGTLDKLGVLLTIRFLYEPELGEQRQQRSGTRWLCSDKFLPVAVAPSPTYFDDWMYFHVQDISASGMLLSTSLRNKYLLPGTSLKLALMFPASGNTTVDFHIRRVGVSSEANGDLLQLGGVFESVDPKSRVVIGQYLVQFAPQASLEELKNANLLPESLFRGVTIRSAKSEDEYRRVLALRFEANQASGQIGSARTGEDLSESDDASSRILLATRGSTDVGTVRIRFPSLEEKIEAEKYVIWPATLPRRDEVFEVSRLAINVAYRGKDVLPSIFHYILLSSIGVDRPWVTISAMGKYIDFYKKIGFVETGLVYSDPKWSNDLNVMIMNSMEAMKGRGTNPFYWYLIWSPVLRDFQRDGVVVLSGMDRIRVALLRLIGKLGSLLRSRDGWRSKPWKKSRVKFGE
jgi:predicted GNAT family N-acyltransferase